MDKAQLIKKMLVWFLLFLHTEGNGISYHLKWVTDDFPFPIIFTADLQQKKDYKWLKYRDNLFIDELKDSSQYLFTESKNKAILYLLSYSSQGHNELSTYEPVLREYSFRKPDERYTFNRNIFTLAYVKSHSLTIQKSANSYDVSCAVTILLPLNDRSINEKNYELIQKYIDLKIMMVDKKDRKKSKVIKKRTTGRNTESSRIRTKRNMENKFIQLTLTEGPIIFFNNEIREYKNADIFICRMSLLETGNIVSYEKNLTKSIYDSNDLPTARATTKAPPAHRTTKFSLINFNTSICHKPRINLIFIWITFFILRCDFF
jgi:hypothetical protein